MSNVLLTSHKKRSILHRLLSLSFVVCRPMGPPLVQVPSPLHPTFFVDDVVELSSPSLLSLCIHYARETGNNNSINAAWRCGPKTELNWTGLGTALRNRSIFAAGCVANCLGPNNNSSNNNKNNSNINEIDFKTKRRPQCVRRPPLTEMRIPIHLSINEPHWEWGRQ